MKLIIIKPNIILMLKSSQILLVVYANKKAQFSFILTLYSHLDPLTKKIDFTQSKSLNMNLHPNFRTSTEDFLIACIA